MKLTKIKRIKDHRVFRDFTWPTSLPEFTEKNLVYGWNGSGKSTLSNLFRALEKGVDLAEGTIEFEIDGRTVKGSSISTVPSLPNVRVFNREFVEENIGRDFETTKPIFFLGKDSIEKQKKIGELKKKQASAEKSIADWTSKKLQCEKRIEQLTARGAREIKSMLRSSETSRYNNYNKNHFKEKCEALEQLDKTELLGRTLDDEGESRCRTEIASKPMDEIQGILDPFPDFTDLHARATELLNTTVKSNSIERLKKDPKLGDWVKQGLDSFHLQKPDQCPYCEQPTPTGFLEALNTHFDEQYTLLLKSIDVYLEEVKSILALLEQVKLPPRALFYDRLQDTFELKLKGYNDDIEQTIVYLKALLACVTEKKLKPFSAAVLDVAEPTIDSRSLDEVNEVIQEHNATKNTFATRVFTARKQLEESYVTKNLAEFSDEKKARECAVDEETREKKIRDSLVAQIEELEHEIISHRPAADELTIDLRSYLGRDEISFEVEDTGYRIERCGKVARNLSEGEKTAIAFLFFLKSLEDKDFSLEEGIVVIDDPVSSLDSNAIYHAYGFIKDRTSGAGQLFILTHNYVFMQQVKKWLSFFKKPFRKFYMVSATISDGVRNSCVRELDPFLEKFESEYQYLFSVVYQSSKSTDGAMEAQYHLPNITRRLLEAFLAFRQPGCDPTVAMDKRLGDVKFDAAKKARILRFTNTHSHLRLVEEQSTHDASHLAEAPSVVRDILELMQSMDSEHCDSMIQRIQLANGGGP